MCLKCNSENEIIAKWKRICNAPVNELNGAIGILRNSQLGNSVEKNTFN